MTYEDQMQFRRKKISHWFRLNPATRKARRRPKSKREEKWKVLIHLDAERIRSEIWKGNLEILGQRKYRIYLK
ncbi:MAG: hypothetical protein ACE5OZ_20685 [Candidatus Heimdallarchaeota archaeon]